MATVTPSTITLRVLLFATYADLTGRHQVEAILPAGSRVADLLTWVRATLPGGAGLPERPLVAVNQRHVRLDNPLESGDEVALLPPMAGG
jgi:molybdopterin converting factor small subunit